MNQPPGKNKQGAGQDAEQALAQSIRLMFDQVAHRYDFLNHLLSFQLDRYWRWRCVQLVKEQLLQENTLVLDLCCGTGDLTLALARTGRARICGCDFALRMLEIALKKSEKHPEVVYVGADALKLPFGSQTFDVVTIAFGFRNLANYERGLEEILRVLKPGGLLLILEFSQPRNPLWSRLYWFYSLKFLPKVGGWISGSPTAYQYLPESIQRFPRAEELRSLLENKGFTNVRYLLLTGGIVAIHLAEKASVVHEGVNEVPSREFDSQKAGGS